LATALLAAAGAGGRLGAGTPKAIVDLAGRPLVAWSLLALDAASAAVHVLFDPFVEPASLPGRCDRRVKLGDVHALGDEARRRRR